MNIQPKPLSYQYIFRTIDSHTMGESTRIVYDGFPEIPGASMMDKKKYIETHFEPFRKALMLEPRGHRDMFGALLTTPVHEEADFGVIFMDSGGYLNMCGHGSIGTASMVVETGMVKVEEPYTEVVLDAPSGIIRTKVHVVNGKAVEVSILNVPSFLEEENQAVVLPGYGEISYDISFGGSFFALVDADKIGLSITMENIDEITSLGMELLQRINQRKEIKHPYLDITTVDLVEFYTCRTTNEKAAMKNCVIFGEAQADRSPCGTGTSAKLATLYTRGELGLHEPFVYESITGSLFTGEVMQEIEISGKKAVIPQITGSAYITGMNSWILDEDDPLEYGFLLGTHKQAEPESSYSKIIKAAWRLFQRKGFSETSIYDILYEADVTEEEFYSNFKKKEDLENTLGDLFDQKYAELMLEMNPRFSHYEKLIYLNRELFTMIEHEVPFNLVKHLYVGDENGTQNLLNEDRLYFKLIPQIIEEGQRKGEFKTAETVETLADTYAALERGMIYDWCVKGARYSLTEHSQKLLPIYLKEFLA